MKNYNRYRGRSTIGSALLAIALTVGCKSNAETNSHSQPSTEQHSMASQDSLTVGDRFVPDIKAKWQPFFILNPDQYSMMGLEYIGPINKDYIKKHPNLEILSIPSSEISTEYATNIEYFWKAFVFEYNDHLFRTPKSNKSEEERHFGVRREILERNPSQLEFLIDEAKRKDIDYLALWKGIGPNGEYMDGKYILINDKKI